MSANLFQFVTPLMAHPDPNGGVGNALRGFGAAQRGNEFDANMAQRRTEFGWGQEKDRVAILEAAAKDFQADPVTAARVWPSILKHIGIEHQFGEGAPAQDQAGVQAAGDEPEAQHGPQEEGIEDRTSGSMADAIHDANQFAQAPKVTTIPAALDEGLQKRYVPSSVQPQQLPAGAADKSALSSNPAVSKQMLDALIAGQVPAGSVEHRGEAQPPEEVQHGLRMPGALLPTMTPPSEEDQRLAAEAPAEATPPAQQPPERKALHAAARANGWNPEEQAAQNRTRSESVVEGLSANMPPEFTEADRKFVADSLQKMVAGGASPNSPDTWAKAKDLIDRLVRSHAADAQMASAHRPPAGRNGPPDKYIAAYNAMNSNSERNQKVADTEAAFKSTDEAVKLLTQDPNAAKTMSAQYLVAKMRDMRGIVTDKDLAAVPGVRSVWDKLADFFAGNAPEPDLSQDEKNRLVELIKTMHASLETRLKDYYETDLSQAMDFPLAQNQRAGALNEVRKYQGHSFYHGATPAQPAKPGGAKPLPKAFGGGG